MAFWQQLWGPSSFQHFGACVTQLFWGQLCMGFEARLVALSHPICAVLSAVTRPTPQLLRNIITWAKEFSSTGVAIPGLTERGISTWVTRCPVCLGRMGFPGCRSFCAKARKVLGQPGWGHRPHLHDDDSWLAKCSAQCLVQSLLNSLHPKEGWSSEQNSQFWQINIQEAWMARKLVDRI